MVKRKRVTVKKQATIKSMLQNIPDEIFLIIFAKLKHQDLLQCRLACKQWFHIINNDKCTMERITLKLMNKSKLELENHHVKANYRRLHLVDITFSKPFNEHFLEVLSTIRHLRLSSCTLRKWNVNVIFQQIFDVCHSLETLHLDNLRINLSGGSAAQKRVKYSPNPDSIGSVKYLNIKFEKIDEALLFFEAFQLLNVQVETLALDYYQGIPNHHQLLELLKLLQQSFERSLKELIFCMDLTNSQYKEFLSQLTEMKSMQLRVFKHKSSISQQNHQELLLKFFQLQIELCELNLNASINREIFEVLTEKLVHLKNLKMRIRPNVDGKYVLEHLHKLPKLKKLSIKVCEWFQDELCPTLKMDLLKNLEYFKLKNEETNLSEDEESDDEPLAVQLSSPLDKLKSFSFINIPSDAFTFETIFEYMPNLEVLKLKCTIKETDFVLSIITDNTIPEKSLSNLKYLRELTIDGFTADYDEFLEILKLPSLQKLVFVPAKFNPDDNRDSEISYVNISNGMLKLIASNCPLLMSINDSVFGRIYKKSEKTKKFFKSRRRTGWFYIGD